jgi:hypothetical protein
MSEAPERIWADGNAEWDSGSWGRSKEFDNDVEYVRADRIEERDGIIRHDRERIEELVSMVNSKDARIEELEAKAMKASNAALLEKRRADEAEGNLAKAVGAVEFYRSAINLRIDCEITYAMQEAHDNAETFLAELKGEDRG